jgi:hypothetical protein
MMPFWLLLSFHFDLALVPVAAAYLFLVRRNLVGFFVLIAFWVGVCFAFRSLGARSTLVFIALWIGGILLSAAFHLQPYFFLAYEAFLSAVLFIMLKCEWA